MLYYIQQFVVSNERKIFITIYSKPYYGNTVAFLLINFIIIILCHAR